MELSREEAQDIVWGDHKDWEEIETEIVDTSRWSVHHEGIFKHISSGKFYSLSWSTGATEMQDEAPFEYTDPEPIEVHQVEKVVKVWEAVSGTSK